MKKMIPLLQQFAACYVSRKPQLFSVFRCILVTAILLSVAMYGFVRLLFQDFDISLMEDFMNLLRATGFAVVFVSILFSPCLLLEAMVYISHTAGNEAAGEQEINIPAYPAL